MIADPALLDAIPDSLIVCNHQGEILWCNGQVRNLLGYRPEELIGHKVEILLPASLREIHQSHRVDYAKEPTLRPMGNAQELFALAKGGRQVPVDIELAPLSWHGERCVAAVIRCRLTKLAQEAEQQTLLRENEERLRRSQAIAKIGTWDWNILEDTVTWSAEIYNIFGLPQNYKIEGIQAIYEMVLPEDEAHFRHYISSATREQTAFAFEHRARRIDGSLCYVRQNGEAFYNAQGEMVRMLGTTQDISKEHERRRQLQLSQTIFENANDGILATDADLNIISANPVIEKLCACTQEQLIGKSILSLVPQYAEVDLSREVRRVVNEEGAWRGESELFIKNAPDIPVMVSVATIQSSDGREDGYIVTVTDISKLKLNEAQLDFLAHYDQLTRLPNRTSLLRELAKRTAQTFTDSSSLYLLYIDLDGFKQINDSQGHSAGDELLYEVAEQLRHCVPDDAFVSRLGGDEFAVVCDFSKDQDAELLARKIIHCLRLHKEFAEISVSISASVGITCCPRDGLEPLELIKKADQAMYEAKANGKDGFEHYSDNVGHMLRRRLQMTSDLSKALKGKELFLDVQPKLNLRDSRAFSVEALARWRHSKLGLIPPDEFIALAEETGQILDLGRQVLTKAMEFIVDWRAAHTSSLSVAVNLSAKQLHDKNLLSDIALIVSHYEVDPSWIEFEITESVVMDNVESSLRLFNALKKMGFRIAIDDFGTGYSSLSYLNKLPIDILKIDRSFIAQLPDNQDDLAIVSAIISMAKSLNIEVVAEGVETEGQYQLLGELGCEQLQGYYFAKPGSLQDYIQKPWSFWQD
ncbi:sensor domain-containing protein [Pseudoteredinibacter isoporae]|uniref:Diguanylate cyclase (GGDEF)-like protein/PAS domain S-box-containing protein n=1 Tax=Pseudoteredinibacter isoporae TaxID=570281 RepID=A0A7X0MXT0_9GAMM|nr:bifunctional diguanylate cyclase/phosphodiesterase [Pseudoteredinibacter isoporae]MBB6523803.1 diguanylate cyclase (GGDEF)-like protein/PAS domain S-box-containing protein [Pseudoteredinibacter isoporae]NHO89323.1 EAL domain-containing protein [Pseudoteredinibacter isoporae]NIB22430.1 EAL domain-containing protein [Pseudoteredinibacter isoporae]